MCSSSGARTFRCFRPWEFESTSVGKAKAEDPNRVGQCARATHRPISRPNRVGNWDFVEERQQLVRLVGETVFA